MSTYRKDGNMGLQPLETIILDMEARERAARDEAAALREAIGVLKARKGKTRRPDQPSISTVKMALIIHKLEEEATPMTADEIASRLGISSTTVIRAYQASDKIVVAPGPGRRRFELATAARARAAADGGEMS